MRYIIEYAILCEKGKVRQTNQDNFWHMGQFLESESEGLPAPITGVTENSATPVFAVFDGMGGAKCGEVAAYLAAKTFDEFYLTQSKSDFQEF